LNSEELEALLAHELAHHVLHHCVRDNLLQFLGRLTVVGDGFTRALEDSFGYELEADRAAVVRLGVDPAALKGCLETIQQDAATNEDTVAPLVAGLSALGIAPSHCAEILRQGPSSLSFWSRWRLAWRLYVDQFTGNMNTSYWHPAIEERIAALAMSSAPINGALPQAMKH
jgi:Zn-dependent protease with chaperone function